jgi:type IV pilus assembly protein PilC
MAEGQHFSYTGLNARGKRVSGVVQAADSKEAQTELKKQQIEVISLTAKRNVLFAPRKKGKKVKIKDVTLFTRFLSTMLSSGLPIVQALDIIGHDQEKASMRELITSIRNDISGGKTLAETFSQHPQHFNELYINLIKAGEKSGTLDKILLRLATYLEKTETLKRKLRKALIYPIAILSVAMIVSGILLIFVVPQFQNMFSSFGAQLPTFTRYVVNLSNFLRSYWWLLLIILVGGFFWLRYLLKTNQKVQRRLDRIILRMYVIGPVIRKGIIARFTRTLSTTLEAGMPIVESMKSMAPIMGNSLYTNAVLRMCDDLNSGNTLSASMISTKLFPNMVIQMISVGEASGRLSDMLNKVADFYEEEVNHVVDNLSTLLEPLIMLVLGVIVGSFVVAMYLPIFRMGSLF